VDSTTTELCDVLAGFSRTVDSTEAVNSCGIAITLISAEKEVGLACLRVLRSARETLLCDAKILVCTNIDPRREVKRTIDSVWLLTSADECESHWRMIL